MSVKMRNFYKRFQLASIRFCTPKELKKEVIALRKQVHGLQISNAKLKYKLEV